MSWMAIETVKAQKSSKIRLTLRVNKGSASMRLIVPSAMGGKLKLDDTDHVSVLLGKDENSGKLKVVRCSPESGFKIGRLKFATTVTFPVPAGVTLVENEGEVPYTLDEDGFIIDLPEWATPGVYTVKDDAGQVVAADKSKPGSLEMQGHDLIMGGSRVRLPKSQAAIMDLLIQNFGKALRKKQIHDHLYALDPEGGADEKIVDVFICRLREVIKEKNLALAIVTHHGLGYELRRPVAG